MSSRRCTSNPHRETKLEPVAAAQPVETLAAELADLPAAARLADHGPLAVYCSRAQRIPRILRELGRLRELTFRRVGEGTGRPSDLDRFDQTYLHLFVWNHERSEVVGAYRIGPTDELVPRFGPDGLYSHGLFRFQGRLLDQLVPAFELGRSFVRLEYQKDYASLGLLWKGVGALVAAQPRYKLLFGPVSISNEYNTVSKQLLLTFLKLNHFQPELGRYLRPRRPPRLRLPRRLELLYGPIARDLDAVHQLVSRLEQDGKGIPVLLRHYLRLNAKLLGFNIDPEFGEVIDGLILVDLTQVDRAILSRFMGRERALQFLAHHGATADRESNLEPLATAGPRA